MEHIGRKLKTTYSIFELTQQIKKTYLLGSKSFDTQDALLK